MGHYIPAYGFLLVCSIWASRRVGVRHDLIRHDNSDAKLLKFSESRSSNNHGFVPRPPNAEECVGTFPAVHESTMRRQNLVAIINLGPQRTCNGSRICNVIKNFLPIEAIPLCNGK
ncbi:hypothetical protein M404DRAFT_349226 [Pisolithus tinctorius Marx 270]|uniref:Uncharacterized protein n=1 Tax=Pisolithus tinctorius Marx 270 TaxID=870435 RepID=A0A0C3PJK5_PISTI|nr:hypothetical protein M404DRAFT_349226 [Pisolithus tinctorius Marx 270]